MSTDPNQDSPAQETSDILRSYVGAVSPSEEAWYAQFRAHVVRREQVAAADVRAGIDAIYEATRGRRTRPVRPPHASGRRIGESYPRTRGRVPGQGVAYLVTCAVVFFSLGIAAGRSGFPPQTLTARSTRAVTWATQVIHHSMRDASVHVTTVINVVKRSTAPYESEPDAMPTRYRVRHTHLFFPLHTS